MDERSGTTMIYFGSTREKSAELCDLDVKLIVNSFPLLIPNKGLKSGMAKSALGCHQTICCRRPLHEKHHFVQLCNLGPEQPRKMFL